MQVSAIRSGSMQDLGNRLETPFALSFKTIALKIKLDEIYIPCVWCTTACLMQSSKRYHRVASVLF